MRERLTLLHGGARQEEPERHEEAEGRSMVECLGDVQHGASGYMFLIPLPILQKEISQYDGAPIIFDRRGGVWLHVARYVFDEPSEGKVAITRRAGCVEVHASRAQALGACDIRGFWTPEDLYRHPDYLRATFVS